MPRWEATLPDSRLAPTHASRRSERVIKRCPGAAPLSPFAERGVPVSGPLPPCRMCRAVMATSELRPLPLRCHCHLHGPSLAFRVPERRPEAQMFRATGPVAIPAHPSLSEVNSSHRGERTRARTLHRGGWRNQRRRCSSTAIVRTGSGDETGDRAVAVAQAKQAQNELRRRRRSEPGGQRVAKPEARAVSHPGDMSVGANQHGSGSSDRAEDRKLPHTVVFGVDELNPIAPWRDVEAAGSSRLRSTGRASCSRVKTRTGPLAVTRSRSGMRRPSSGCRRLSGAVSFTTCASFHPRFTASCTPVLSPCPPIGECTCAPSPANNTRIFR
jgi:hypothetical protein